MRDYAHGKHIMFFKDYLTHKLLPQPTGLWIDLTRVTRLKKHIHRETAIW